MKIFYIESKDKQKILSILIILIQNFIDFAEVLLLVGGLALDGLDVFADHHQVRKKLRILIYGHRRLLDWHQLLVDLIILMEG